MSSELSRRSYRRSQNYINITGVARCCCQTILLSTEILLGNYRARSMELLIYYYHRTCISMELLIYYYHRSCMLSLLSPGNYRAGAVTSYIIITGAVAAAVAELYYIIVGIIVVTITGKLSRRTCRSCLAGAVTGLSCRRSCRRTGAEDWS